MTLIVKPIHNDLSRAGAKVRLEDWLNGTYCYPVYRGTPPPGTPTMAADLVELVVKAPSPEVIYGALSDDGWLDGWVTWEELSEERRSSFAEAVTGGSR